MPGSLLASFHQFNIIVVQNIFTSFSFPNTSQLWPGDSGTVAAMTRYQVSWTYVSINVTTNRSMEHKLNSCSYYGRWNFLFFHFIYNYFFNRTLHLGELVRQYYIMRNPTQFDAMETDCIKSSAPVTKKISIGLESNPNK